MPELENELSWNEDTVVTFVDNLILISGHLSSEKDKNRKQVYDMIQSLKKLNALYPMFHIIVGCDANSYVPKTFKEITLKDILKEEPIKENCVEEKIQCTCKVKVNLSSYS